MFRRRPLRRRILRRPLAPVGPPPGGPRQALLHANQLMENGDYKEAAEIFERLADGAEKREMFRRAPYLFLQAARARLWASQVQRADELLYRGLNILVRTGQWNTLYRLGNTAINEYKRLEQQEAADKLQAWLDEALGDHPEATQPASTRPEKAIKRATLPGKCPYCGASIRPDEVEWLDQQTAECVYCGSSVKAEKDK